MSRNRAVNKYEWNSKPIRKNRSHVYYESLKIIACSDSINIYQGTNILIENSNRKDKPYVGHVITFYAENSNRNSPKIAVIRWFLRPDECKALGVSHPEMEQDELALYRGEGIPNTINVRTIKWPCYVLHFDQVGKITYPKNRHQYFFCRYQYKEGFQKLQNTKLDDPINIEEISGTQNPEKSGSGDSLDNMIEKCSKIKIKASTPKKVLMKRCSNSKVETNSKPLSPRRSKRRSAVHARVKIIGLCEEVSSEKSEDEEYTDTDMSSDEYILRTPKKRARILSDKDSSTTSITPSKTPSKTSARTPAKTPSKLRPKTPAKTPSKTRATTSAKTPSKRGTAPSLYQRKSEPKRDLLPEFIKKSGDLKDILQQASKRLALNAVPDSLPCRESEYQNIFNFIEDKLNHNMGGCLYISGVPGTGKTATTQEVVSSLRKECQLGNIKQFKYVELNGMRMTRPKEAYAAIWSQISGEKRTADHASILINEYLESKKMKHPILMLVDELDLLITRKQDVLYRIFDWPQNYKIIVLAIANTFDLPERVMHQRIQSRLGLSRETFSPYTYTQLETIIKSRLGSNLCRLFEDTGIAFAARKVAGLSGDARRALGILKEALESSIIRYDQSSDPSDVYVRLSHVIKAVEKINCNPSIMLMKSAPFHAQLFLRGLVAACLTCGNDETTVDEVFYHITALSYVDGNAIPVIPEVIAIANWLESSGFILTNNLMNGIHTKVSLNVPSEDVIFAYNKT